MSAFQPQKHSFSNNLILRTKSVSTPTQVRINSVPTPTMEGDDRGLTWSYECGGCLFGRIGG